MHELALCRAIVDTAVAHAGGRRVTAVELRVGRLRQVIPRTLDFYFPLVARGTPCEGATLTQEIVDARMRCRPCRQEWTLQAPVFRCPGCGGVEVEVTGGNEFQVVSIEIEEPLCIA